LETIFFITHQHYIEAHDQAHGCYSIYPHDSANLSHGIINYLY